MREQTLFIYLDAHWEEDLPLAEELAVIARATTRCIVMIDDFQVPGDGYAYDNYGPGKALVEDSSRVSAERLGIDVSDCTLRGGDRRQAGMLRPGVARSARPVLDLRQARIL